MRDRPRGLYEVLITEAIASQLRDLGDDLHASSSGVRSAEAPDRLAFHLSRIVQRAIAGVNDALEQTRPLGALARNLHAKVNLIPYNTVEGLAWARPDEPTCEAFLAALEKQRVIATLRREKGHDIDAACGQLRLKTEKELAVS